MSRTSDSAGGLFWMSFDDFAAFFCSVDVCKTHMSTWFEARMSSYFATEGARDMIAYTLIVCETCEVNIGLYHKTVKSRHENSDLDLCFVVFRAASGRTVGDAVGKLVMASKRQIRKFIGGE